tara:strand:- start:69 stop:389 length:321 start_codon:yes stop_codon:yes gene_type:complete
MPKKKQIPRALREQCWLKFFGKTYEHKCYIDWCSNKIDVFNYHVGHNIPESKGGQLFLDNLKPICSRCNYSMGNQYTITEWIKLGNVKLRRSKRFFHLNPFCLHVK